jgi:hypothetical protein
LTLAFTAKKALPVLCGLEVLAGGEITAVRNVVHSDLTVPEPPPALRPPSSEEAGADGDDLGIRALLWIVLGAVIFMYLFYRFALLKRRSA